MRGPTPQRQNDATDPARDRTVPGPWSRRFHPVVVVDAVLLVLVCGILMAAFALPAERKWALALSYGSPTLLSAFASHFVHLSLSHLLVNLGGFVLVAGTGYLLSLASGARTRFMIAFLTFVLVFPPVISGLELLTADTGVAVGFSAIVLAFVGYLPVAIFDFVRDLGLMPVDRTHSRGLFFLGSSVVVYSAVPGVYGATLAAVTLVAGVVFSASVLTGATSPHRASVRASTSVAGHVELLAAGLLLFFAYPLISFPAVVTDVPTTGSVGSGTLDVFSHALGFCLGYVVTYVTLLVTDRERPW